MEMIQPLLAFLVILMAGPAAPREPIFLGPVAVAFWLLSGWLVTRGAVRTHMREHAGTLLHPPRGQAFLHLGLWACVCFFTPWIPFVRTIAPVPFLWTLVAFAPVALHRLLRCHATWPVEAACPGREWTMRQYVVFSLRVLALPVAPLFVLYGLLDILLVIPSLDPWVAAYADFGVPLTTAALLLIVFAVSPAFVRWVLGARPLPPGSLRDRLVAYGNRWAFKPTNILVWRTGNTVSNALYIGIVPFFRYIVLTDALMRQLSEEEIEAVYAHEAGHGMRRHTQLYVLMALGMALVSSTWALAVPEWVASTWDGADAVNVELMRAAIATPVVLLLMVLFFVVGLGWLSRRFETEADLWAIRTLEDPDQFSRALERVGLHTGGLRPARGGMRHFGIGTRIGLINRYRSEPEFRHGFDRLIRRCRGAIVGFMVLGVLGAAFYVPAALAVGDTQLLLIRGQEAEEAANHAQARDLYGAAATRAGAAAAGHVSVRITSERQQIAALAALGDLHLKDGDWAEAAKVIEKLKARLKKHDALGHFNTGYVDALYAGAMGEPDAERARALIRNLGEMVSLVNGWNRSVALCYSDLWLLHRSAGGKDRPRGRPPEYSAAARLLLGAEKSPGQQPSARLLKEAREDLATNALRRVLFDRAAPEDLKQAVDS